MAEMDSHALARVVREILEEHKAEDVRLVEMRNHFADVFVLATAMSGRHLHSLADDLVRALRERGVKAHHAEGVKPGASDRWVLVDLFDVVVHLFTEEGRAYYAMDRLLEDYRNLADSPDASRD